MTEENFTQMSNEELQLETQELNNQIEQIDELINNVRNSNSNPRQTTETLQQITDVYNNVMEKIKLDDILNKENRLFRNEQYFQNKKINEYSQQLSELKSALEILNNNRSKFSIKSIKNPITGTNLNVHNVSPIYDNKIYAVTNDLFPDLAANLPASPENIS